MKGARERLQAAREQSSTTSSRSSSSSSSTSSSSSSSSSHKTSSSSHQREEKVREGRGDAQEVREEGGAAPVGFLYEQPPGLIKVSSLCTLVVII